MYKNFSLKQIADSGQVFRFNETEEGCFEVISRDRILTVREGDIIHDEFWKHYFDLETDYGRFISAIPKEDEYLTNAAAYAQGVRILNQDPWEMLISFIISQRKSIPAIKTSIEKLCRAFGRQIKREDGKLCYAFPDPEELAEASMNELDECSLGYRSDYIYRVSRQVADGEIDLEAMRALSNEELYNELLKIRGVGCKVANCVMLFGYHRIGAFPVDVWIQRIMDQYYQGHFPTEKYEGFAGVLQQYMFYGKDVAFLHKS